jgi:hypothetical protein
MVFSEALKMRWIQTFMQQELRPIQPKPHAYHTHSFFSDPQRGLKTFTSNPVNSHELVAGGKGLQMMLVNTARGEIVTRVSIHPSSGDIT